MRQFETGATRDVDTNKFDYEGFLHPLVMERFAEYMHENRIQADGNLRAADNWQKGIPKDAYMKSAFRHFMDVWKEHRGIKTKDGMEKAICALMFNIMGYLFELLKDKQNAEEEVHVSSDRTQFTNFIEELGKARPGKKYNDITGLIPSQPVYSDGVPYVPRCT